MAEYSIFYDGFGIAMEPQIVIFLFGTLKFIWFSANSLYMGLTFRRKWILKFSFLFSTRLRAHGATHKTSKKKKKKKGTVRPWKNRKIVFVKSWLMALLISAAMTFSLFSIYNLTSELKGESLLPSRT